MFLVSQTNSTEICASSGSRVSFEQAAKRYQKNDQEKTDFSLHDSSSYCPDNLDCRFLFWI